MKLAKGSMRALSISDAMSLPPQMVPIQNTPLTRRDVRMHGIVLRAMEKEMQIAVGMTPAQRLLADLSNRHIHNAMVARFEKEFKTL